MSTENQTIENMSDIEVRDELARLHQDISSHDKAYYQDDRPVISDGEYDILRQRLIAIEEKFTSFR